MYQGCYILQLNSATTNEVAQKKSLGIDASCRSIKPVVTEQCMYPAVFQCIFYVLRRKANPKLPLESFNINFRSSQFYILQRKAYRPARFEMDLWIVFSLFLPQSFDGFSRQIAKVNQYVYVSL